MKRWRKLLPSSAACARASASDVLTNKSTAPKSPSGSRGLHKMAKLLTCAKRSNAKEAFEDVSDKDVLKSLGYTLGRTIGEGTYSKVYIAAHKTERVACKIIQKKLAGAEFIQKFLPRELSIVRHLRHRHIVAVHDVIEERNAIYIVMDYCKCGDLLEFVRERGPLDDDLAKVYFRQIVSAVSYLHALNIAHRDLKCENVLLATPKHVKLADFGFARFCVTETGAPALSETYCGSAAYAAPEIIQGVPYDPKTYDLWALGCILYIMIAATMPFDDSNVKKMLRNQLHRSLCASAHRSWHAHCVHLQNLIAYLLEPDVTRRATIAQVRNCVWLAAREDLARDVADDKQLSKSSLF